MENLLSFVGYRVKKLGVAVALLTAAAVKRGDV